MKNKTCGECRHLTGVKSIGICEKQGMPLCPAELPACSKFEQKVITNGDLIRQMSNEELAEMLSDPCSMCVYNVDLQCERVGCEQNIEDWLNAPADCVKQNENHDTQTDLCCTDNTEKEGKDE